MESSGSLVHLRRIKPLRRMSDSFQALNSSAALVASIQQMQALKRLIRLCKDEIHILLEWGN